MISGNVWLVKIEYNSEYLSHILSKSLIGSEAIIEISPLDTFLVDKDFDDFVDGLGEGEDAGLEVSHDLVQGCSVVQNPLAYLVRDVIQLAGLIEGVGNLVNRFAALE